MNIKRRFFGFILAAVTVFSIGNVNKMKAVSEQPDNEEQSSNNNQNTDEARNEIIRGIRHRVFSSSSLRNVLRQFLNHVEDEYEILHISRDSENIFSYTFRDNLRDRGIGGGMCVDWTGVEQANAIEELLRQLMQLSENEEIVSYEGMNNNQVHMFKIRTDSGEVVDRTCPEQLNNMGEQNNV